MKHEYRHTQVGRLSIVIFAVTGALIATVVFSMISDGRVGAAAVTTALALLGIALFYAFTVEVAGGKLRFWFGVGGIRGSYAIEEIESYREVRNPWYYMWGIKSIPGGWLYAIAPGSAVELQLKNGKMIRLGTNQPKELMHAIDDAVESKQPSCSGTESSQ